MQVLELRRAFDLILIMKSTYHLAMELLLAWGFTASRPSTRSVKWPASAQWNAVPQSFSPFKSRSFTGLTGERKLRL